MPKTRPATGSTRSADTTPAGRFQYLAARVLTEGLSPIILVPAISVAVAWHSGSTLWGLVAAGFAAGLPLAYIVRGMRRGDLTDHHVDAREKRPAVLLVTVASVIAGIALMAVLDAPRQLVALVIAMLAGLALTLPVTVVWKVSLHGAVAAGTATILVLVFGRWWILASLLVAAIGWSRVYLRNHSTAQVIVGIVLGGLAAGVVYPLLA